jgi:putative membrane protein
MREPIKNKIDRQREHQANERTFLAWLRTSIALIGFGFAIARFSLFLRQLQATLMPQVPPHPVSNSEDLGVVLVLVGILMIGLSAWRYNQVFYQIERADYQPNRLFIWVFAIIMIILGVLSIPLILWRDRSSSIAPNSYKQPPRQLSP